MCESIYEDKSWTGQVRTEHSLGLMWIVLNNDVYKKLSGVNRVSWISLDNCASSLAMQ